MPNHQGHPEEGCILLKSIFRENIAQENLRLEITELSNHESSLIRIHVSTHPTPSVSAISCSGVDLNRLRNDSTISRYLKEKNDCDWPIGGGDTEVDITLERVLQTMRVGEKCEAAIR